MRWLYCSQVLNIFLVIIILCSFIQVDGKIRRRRQYLSNNFGAYALDPAVVSYYGTGGGGSYTGNSQQNNRFIVGGVVYQYPTPVNVMSGGQYDSQQYNAYLGGSDSAYYYNMNNMKLPAADRWYPGYYFQGYPFLPLLNNAQRHVEISIITKVFFIIFTCLISISIL